jgi:hypothetical protein
VSLAEPRTAAQRKADTLAKLSAAAADIWVASASIDDAGAARPYLVRSPSAGSTDGSSSRSKPTRAPPAACRSGRGPGWPSARPGWDPRTAGGRYVYLVLVPRRIQAWREVNELPRRTLMRNGEWLV